MQDYQWTDVLPTYLSVKVLKGGGMLIIDEDSDIENGWLEFM